MSRKLRKAMVLTLVSLSTFVLATTQVTCQGAEARPSLATLDAMMVMVKEAVCRHYLLSGDPLPAFCPAPGACDQPVEAGPCKAAIPRWAYDPDTGRCESFIYGGCGANENNFPTKEACEGACIPCDAECEPHEECRLYDPCAGGACDLVPICVETCERVRCRPGEECREIPVLCVTGPCPPIVECVPTPSACDAPADPGPCLASIPRWAYDDASGDCQTFQWGGCAGNDNNFASLAECRAECVGDPCDLPTEPGPCHAYLPRWSYDAGTDECEAFVYGGCGGNANNFATQAACEQTCAGDVDPCSLPTEVGPCLASIPRFSYDADTGQCEPFLYGGCGGNANNFTSLEACERTCSVRSDPCALEPDAGPCKAVIPRYYFDPGTGACESFVYGGCGGNDNNFADAASCERACGR